MRAARRQRQAGPGRAGGCPLLGGVTHGDPRLGGEGPAEVERNKEITRPQLGSARPHTALPAPLQAGRGGLRPLFPTVPRSPVARGSPLLPGLPQHFPGMDRAPKSPCSATAAPGRHSPRPGPLRYRHRLLLRSGFPVRGARGAPPSRCAPFRRSLQQGKHGGKAAAMLHLGGAGGRHPSSSRPESPQIEAVVIKVD